MSSIAKTALLACVVLMALSACAGAPGAPRYLPVQKVTPTATSLPKPALVDRPVRPAGSLGR